MILMRRKTFAARVFIDFQQSSTGFELSITVLTMTGNIFNEI